ncbi:Dimeric dUTPase (All-alpha-NTP-PPase superfamily) OS=Ureibacillus acetophenoni OX=614649 GN=SAMN05877842_102309 PE=4 SV=1 [Ureibacillus acetophenoni]
MFTQIEVKNGLINVAQLQEKVDEIIFDYIDTSKNWAKAHKGLNNLYQQTVRFFVDYVDNQNGSIPKGNVYWTLFAEIVARITYFKTLAERHLKDLQTDVDVENIIKGYSAAANCLPNVKVIKEHDLLDEISESFEEIHLQDGVKGNFKQSIIENNNTIQENLKAFYHFSISTTKANQK